MIYLDNAATSCRKPETVYTAVDHALRNCSGNPGRSGHALSLEAGKIVLQARLRCAALFGVASAKNICFGSNATEALNLAIHGIVKPGAHVITSALEHNSVARPLEFLKRYGVDVTVLPASLQEGVSAEAVASAIRPNTSLVVMTHISNVTGTVNDIAKIGHVCKEAGIPFLVDAAQSAGNHKIDVQEMNIDLLAFPGHKGLLGPQGTGGLYVNEDILLDPLKQGGTGSLSESLMQPEEVPDRYESGTLNVPGLAGLAAGIEFVLNTGIDAIAEKEHMLTAKLIHGLLGIPGVRLYGPDAETDRGAVVSITIDGIAPQEVALILDSAFSVAVRAGLHCSPYAHKAIGTLQSGGTVRISPNYFSSEEEIDTCLEGIEAIASGGI